MDDDLGTLAQHGDHWTLTFTRRLPHPQEKVWRAVTEPEHLAVWFPDRIVGDRRAGAKLRFEQASGDGFDGEMVVFDPPSVMELLWGTDRLRIELRPDGEATVLTLTDTLTELGKAARDGAGWHECLGRLGCELDGTEPPAWATGWRELFQRYIDHLGPDASTIGPPPGWDDPVTARQTDRCVRGRPDVYTGGSGAAAPPEKEARTMRAGAHRRWEMAR